MGEIVRCVGCGGSFPRALPWDLCPRCLLEAELEEDAELPGVEVRCPYCAQTVEVSRVGSVRHVACPQCSGRFVLFSPDKKPEDAHSHLGRFDLLEVVGAGSFGTVWKAWDPQLGRTVAVKVPHRRHQPPVEAEEFLHEARAAAQLSHAGIVAVHEVGDVGGRVFIVSDYIEGAKLDEWIKSHPLSFEQAAQLCGKIADALHYAHEAGIVHRDLKPSNILVDAHGDPHLLDFGLAKQDAGEISMTFEGKILGTPAYMSPEQARGESHRADRRSDVYALGVVLYELLSGEKPFRGNPQTLLHQVMHEDPPPLHKLNYRIPRDLETICLKCLEKEPRKRYDSSLDVAEELRRFLRGEPVRARPLTRVRRAGRWCSRNPLAATLGGVLAAVLVSLAIVGPLVAMRQTTLAWQEASARERAEQEKLRALMIYRKAGEYYERMLGLLLEMTDKTEADSNYRRRLAGQCNDLAWLLVTNQDIPQEKPTDSLGLAQIAVERMPEESAYWRTLGLAQYRAGDWQKALETLSTSVAKARPEEDTTATCLCLSMTCCRLGQYPEAWKWYERAARRDGDVAATSEVEGLRKEAEALLGIGGKEGHR